MNRLTEAWFEFNGIRCDEKHIRMMAMPKRPIAAHQGERLEIPGRDGFLWKDNMARGAIEIAVECSTTDGYSADELATWLCGRGWLRFSDEPNRAYKAYVIEEFVRENTFLRFDRQRFTVQFSCQPHRYVYPSAEPSVLTTPDVIYNPGTADSLPRIKIEGSGDMTVYIGAYQIDVSGGSVIIDSEMMDCFNADGITLANSRVTMDEFPRLLPMGNAVSWNGSVTKVTIEGRWRCI